MHKNNKGKELGFTLIELVVVIVILSILAATAMPKFLDLRDEATQASFEGVMGGLGSALSVAKAAYATGKDTEMGLPPDADDNGFPDHLGSTGDPLVINGFFSGVLEVPVKNANFGGNGAGKIGWKTQASWHPSGTRYYYVFDADGNNNFSATNDNRIVYNPATGRITQDWFGADH